jgi:uncharacterized protein YukE
MANLYGMDVEQVRQMGRQMQAQADHITGSIIPQLDGLVNNIPSVWAGPDANMFKDWWTGQHRAHLVAVAHDLRGLGQSALNNAQEQSEVSSH